jgi:outer membrane murein-binding lipoprotein Lpp
MPDETGEHICRYPEEIADVKIQRKRRAAIVAAILGAMVALFALVGSTALSAGDLSSDVEHINRQVERNRSDVRELQRDVGENHRETLRAITRLETKIEEMARHERRGTP